MIEPDHQHSRKGHYLGTEIDEKWWKRYMRDKLFARGNGVYWYDNSALYFRRYLTTHPIVIPFGSVIELKTGNSHAGRWVFGKRVVKLIWSKDGRILSSGFVLSRTQQETETILADLKHRIG